MIQDPILHAFGLLARRAPLAPLVATPERRAAVEDVDALARAAGRSLAGPPRPPLPPGSAVGLVAPNGPGMLASLLAVRRAGLAAILLDPLSPETEALRTVEALGGAAVLRCRTGWPHGPEDWTLTAAPASSLHLPDIAVVKLTSGSTGAPRGIATPSEALVADDAALAVTMGYRDGGEGDRLLATIPLSHSYGLSSLAMPALMRGTLLILPEEDRVFDPFDAAMRTGATVFPTVPAVLDALLRLNEPPAWPETLRLVLTAGAPLSPATAARFRETFGLPVHVFYGASECGGICFDREGTAGERGTVGTPVEGVRIDLEPVASPDIGDGEEGGMVTVRSPAVASGYLPALPADGDRLGGGRFVNGDVAVWKDGELVLRGRADNQINIKGKKVNPREVETVVGQLPGVLEVAVLGVPLPGRSEPILRAVIACLPGSLSVEEVVAWCRPRLSPHKVPRSVVLVPELPRNTRGKLDRRELRALRGAEG